MNCQDFAAIIDEHRESQLRSAQRCALDEHLAACEECALAWRAQTALLAWSTPVPCASLLDDVLHAVRTSATPAALRRSRTSVVLAGALLAGGAALAAVTFVTVTNRATDRSTLARTLSQAGAPAPVQPVAGRGMAGDGAASVTRSPATAVDLVEAELSTVPVVRKAPPYPPEALNRGQSGSATLKFTVTAAGSVTDVVAVDSTDAIFEAPAIAAVSSWKYLPRIAAGRRVPVHDVHTVIRFELASSAAAPPPAARDVPTPDDGIRYADYLAFERGLEVAWERISADDLRGAELTLDELRATYALNPRQLGGVYDFYGYIYTLYGDYGRAIAAYETAIATYGSEPARYPEGRWLALANLYFARHQYDMALRTLLSFKERLRRAPGVTRTDEQAEAFIDRLRALGVTEATL